MRNQEDFLKSAEAKAFDLGQRQRMQELSYRFMHQLEEAKTQYTNLEAARERAAYYKWKVQESLDKYLIEFEANLLRKGGKVIWAVDAETACAEIEALIARNNVQHIVKSKTSIGEEIGLTSLLRKKAIRVTEAGIGEYIQDQSGEAPFHMLASAVNKNREEVAALLNDKIGVSIEAPAEEIITDIRQAVRADFTVHDLAITGADFLIAENGMVAITENEGNARMAVSFAKTHLVLAGIDKIIPALNDLDTYFPLLSAYATGQKLATYNTITGPRQQGDPDGPSEFIVILMDNGRSNVLAQPDQRQALSCIHCGACSFADPVFKTIGGHAYHTTYTGPIGAVITPYMRGLDEFKHLSYASTVDGRPTKVCPVKIDLDNHILRNRRDSVQQGMIKSGDKLVWYSWKKMMLNRKNMNKGASVKNFMLKSFFKSLWGDRREFPKVAEKSFNQLWRDRTNQ